MTRILSRLALAGAICTGLVAGPAIAADDASVPTYSNEVARIFQANCQNCHRTGVQFTPMGLMSYEEARPWARSIKAAVQSREMPPWHANPEYGEFSNDISLTEKEIETIVAWVDAGAPQGNPADMPEPVAFSEGWQIGEPDVIIDMGTDFVVPAEGIVDYQNFVVEVPFEEDVWVQAMEVRAGNLDVVHHSVIYVRNPRAGLQLPDRLGPLSGNGGMLGALSPGNTPSVYHEGQGKLIKKGAKIIFNMHYTPCGRETTDRTYLGFKLHKKPVKQQILTRGVANLFFQIPPNTADYEVVSQHLFDKDVTIMSMMPHMHYRGTAFRYTAEYPDGTKEIVLDVPNYDFDWQVYYYPEQPIKLPKGSKLVCEAKYNNTAEYGDGRPYFDPTETVTFGEQSHEEMMIGWVDYVVDSEDLTKLAENEEKKSIDGQDLSQN